VTGEQAELAFDEFIDRQPTRSRMPYHVGSANRPLDDAELRVEAKRLADLCDDSPGKDRLLWRAEEASTLLEDYQAEIRRCRGRLKELQTKGDVECPSHHNASA
jgi:hypothetical protein